MREDVNRKLRLLAQIVTFGWLDSVVQQEDKYTWAYTNCNESLSARLETGAPGSGKKGFGSKISTGMLQTREMRAVRRRSPRNFKSLGRLLRYQLVIAIGICHETMHALGHAMWDDPSHFEPYYCDQRLNELGFAWETAVLGGTISDTLEAGCFYPLTISTLPSLNGGEGDL